MNGDEIHAMAPRHPRQPRHSHPLGVREQQRGIDGSGHRAHLDRREDAVDHPHEIDLPARHLNVASHHLHAAFGEVPLSDPLPDSPKIPSPVHADHDDT